MDFSWIVPLLSLITLLAVLVFALLSRKAVEHRMDDNTPKSTLASDGPQGGFAAINPAAAVRQQEAAQSRAAAPVLG